MREGKHTDSDINVLKERMLKLCPDHPDYPIIATHLFSNNLSVDQHNHEIFNKSINEKVQIKAIDIVLGDLFDELKERLKKQILNDPSKTMGLCILFVVFLKRQSTILQQMFQSLTE